MPTMKRARTRIAVGLAIGLLGAGAMGGCTQIPSEFRPAAIQPDSIANTASGSFLASQHAQRRRDVAAAGEFALKALEAAPNNLEFLARAHPILVEAGRLDDAAKIAAQLVAIDPDYAPGHLTLAVVEMRADRLEEARARLARLPIQGVNRLVHPLMLAWIDMALGRPAAALNALRPVQEVQGFRSMHDYHAGLIAEMAGRFPDAEDYFRRALDGDGGAPPRLVEALGGFLERRGRASEARALYLRMRGALGDSPVIRAGLARTAGGGAPAAAPASPVPNGIAGAAEALANLAASFRQENTIGLALAYARMAVYLNPRDAAALATAGDILDQLDQRADADALYMQVDPASPYGYAARLRIAENRHESGDTDGAVRLLDQLASERADRIEPLVTMGNALREKERFVEAAAAYGRAIARLGAPEARHWSIFYVRGIAFERAKNWPAAEQHFKRALELQPDQPDVLNYLAYTWVDKGLNIVEAERMLKRAVEQRPNSGHIVDSLAWAYFRLGRFEEAVPLLERAVELLPQDATVLDHLGDGLWRVGRQLEATFQWRRALENEPEPDLKRDIEKKLRGGLPPLAPTPAPTATR
jgi:tetratricopeptide (TPR) repeat protein